MPTSAPALPSSQARAIAPRSLVASLGSRRPLRRAFSVPTECLRGIPAIPARCCPYSTRSQALSSVSRYRPSSGATRSRGPWAARTRHGARRSMRAACSPWAAPRASSPLPHIPGLRRSATSSTRRASPGSGLLTTGSGPVPVALAVRWWKVPSPASCPGAPARGVPKVIEAPCGHRA